ARLPTCAATSPRRRRPRSARRRNLRCPRGPFGWGADIRSFSFVILDQVRGADAGQVRFRSAADAFCLLRRNDRCVGSVAMRNPFAPLALAAAFLAAAPVHAKPADPAAAKAILMDSVAI